MFQCKRISNVELKVAASHGFLCFTPCNVTTQNIMVWIFITVKITNLTNWIWFLINTFVTVCGS